MREILRGSDIAAMKFPTFGTHNCTRALYKKLPGFAVYNRVSLSVPFSPPPRASRAALLHIPALSSSVLRFRERERGWIRASTDGGSTLGGGEG
jgi:hypothetical protein